MEIKLNKNIKGYLLDTLQKENEDIFLELKLKEKSTLGTQNFFKVDENLAECIRDWAINKQQVVGFDEDYDLTSEGETLQEIIDKFYT